MLDELWHFPAWWWKQAPQSACVSARPCSPWVCPHPWVVSSPTRIAIYSVEHMKGNLFRSLEFLSVQLPPMLCRPVNSSHVGLFRTLALAPQSGDSPLLVIPRAVDWNFPQGKILRLTWFSCYLSGSLPLVANVQGIENHVSCIFLVPGGYGDPVTDTQSWLRVKVQSSVLHLK